ncbi:2-keto-4-pentenoate hydratase [Streptomyces sp. NPDC060194]|uniref:2-keto-4-pentenoate hydratase n=1 Tax=Streptomyces sp. NPDC060194 TaxID=3347069 RepID=UPI00365CC7C5
MWTAARERVPCPPVRALIGTSDVGTAYAVQRRNLERAAAGGRRVAGRKIGLTSPAVQRQLGVDEPDFGALLADAEVPDGGEADLARLLQPRIEAEVALVLGADLTDPDCGADDVRAAVARLHPALEIVDSRVADWDITLVDTVADNASAGLYVLGGDGRPPLPGDGDLSGVRMLMRRGTETVSQGSGADCLGGPLLAARWLAVTLARLGDPLRAGDVVLTGALGPVVPVAPGDVFTAELTGLGEVSVRFPPAKK